MIHPAWTEAGLASPTVLGVIDTSGMERIPPLREGHSLRPRGRTGLAHHRGMGGGTLGLLRHQYGLVVAGDGATAQVPDNTLQWLMRPCDERMMVCSATAWHAAAGEPANLKLCQRGTGHDRMLSEPVLSMLPVVSHGKKVMHRVWA